MKEIAEAIQESISHESIVHVTVEASDIYEALQNGETVTLDFEGMSQLVLYLLKQRS